MPYAIVSQDLPDRCPTFRAKPRERVQPVLMRLAAPQKQVQVRVLSGRVLGVSHRMVMFAEAPSAEAIRAFAMGSSLVSWNSIQSYPLWGFDEAIQHASSLTAITRYQRQLGQQGFVVAPARKRRDGPLRSSRSCPPVGLYNPSLVVAGDR
jgi:hypothetical protein